MAIKWYYIVKLNYVSERLMW